MEEVHIDTGNRQAQLERARARLQTSSSVSENNKTLILRYLRDAALGKTILARAKKKIGPARLHSYISHLTMLATHVQMDLDTLTQPDMESFVEALENDQIRSRRRRFTGYGDSTNSRHWRV